MKKSKPAKILRNRCVWGVQVQSYEQEVAYGPRNNHQFHIYAVHPSKKGAWKHIMDILEDRAKRSKLVIRTQPWDVKYQKIIEHFNIEHFTWMLEYRVPHYSGPKRGKDYIVSEDITLYQWYVSQGGK